MLISSRETVSFEFLGFFKLWYTWYTFCICLTYSQFKILRYFQKCDINKSFNTYSCRCITKEIIRKTKKYDFPNKGYKMMKIRVIFYNWKTTDRMKSRVSLNNSFTSREYVFESLLNSAGKSKQIIFRWIVLFLTSK